VYCCCPGKGLDAAIVVDHIVMTCFNPCILSFKVLSNQLFWKEGCEIGVR